MAKIKNPYYKAFLEGYLLEVITREDIKIVIDNIQHKYRDQARALVIVSWFTGARPNEILRLTGNNFIKNKEYLQINIPGSKGGKARTLSLPWINSETGEQDELVHELWNYISTIFMQQLAFWNFKSNAKRYGVTKKIKKRNETTGEIETKEKRYDKIYDEISSKLRYYYPKWFKVLWESGIPPYYLRHSRGTVVADTAGGDATTMVLGHTSDKTRERYIHQTKKTRKKIGEALVK